MSIALSAVALALVVAFVTTRFLCRFNGGWQILDQPNERSLHNVPTPRTGGLGIWLGLVFGMMIVVTHSGIHDKIMWIGTSALAVGIVSVIDDRFDLSAGVRLAVHIIAVVLLIQGGLGLDTIRLPGLQLEVAPEAALVLTVLFGVWMTNLYNFMDGMDGFSGGMAVLGFGTLGTLGYLAGDSYFASMNWVIAAAAGGFLILNFPPARIFMGDTGSSTLGLLAATMGLWADRQGVFPLWITALVFSPFIVDASVTLGRRLVKRERVWQAHRRHYYQRLVQAGWSHRRAVLWEYALMIVCGFTAIVAVNAPAAVQWLILGGVVVVYIAAIAGVHRVEACFPPSGRYSRKAPGG